MVGGRSDVQLQSASVQSLKFFARVVRFVSNGHMGSLIRGHAGVTVSRLVWA
jgi:hypothetical protein